MKGSFSNQYDTTKTTTGEIYCAFPQLQDPSTKCRAVLKNWAAFSRHCFKIHKTHMSQLESRVRHEIAFEKDPSEYDITELEKMHVREDPNDETKFWCIGCHDSFAKLSAALHFQREHTIDATVTSGWMCVQDGRRVHKQRPERMKMSFEFEKVATVEADNIATQSQSNSPQQVASPEQCEDSGWLVLENMQVRRCTYRHARASTHVHAHARFGCFIFQNTSQPCSETQQRHCCG